MHIGLLRERKHDERRVGLRPSQVEELINLGHTVFVEGDAGLHAGYSNEEYLEAGATITEQKEVYKQSRLLIKVKCPLIEEYSLLNSDHTLFTYFHFDLSISPENITTLIKTGATFISYEWVEEDGSFPLLQPMSELTGAVFARKSMDLLMTHSGLLGGDYDSRWPTSTAMIIGAGTIGTNAINVFLRNSFKVIIVDKHPETLRKRAEYLIPSSLWNNSQIEIIIFDESNPIASVDSILARLPVTDIVIGAAVRRPSFPKDICEFIIRREDLKLMKKNSVLCDATACDDDFFETAIPTESLSKHYVEEGIIHYNCDHIPSLVASTATQLLSDATFPYVRLLADLDFKEAVSQNIPLYKGVMAYKMKLTHKISATKKGLEFTELASLF